MTTTAVGCWRNYLGYWHPLALWIISSVWYDITNNTETTAKSPRPYKVHFEKSHFLQSFYCYSRCSDVSRRRQTYIVQAQIQIVRVHGVGGFVLLYAITPTVWLIKVPEWTCFRWYLAMRQNESVNDLTSSASEPKSRPSLFITPTPHS